MSGQMNAFGSIVDLDGIKKCLYVDELASGNIPTKCKCEFLYFFVTFSKSYGKLAYDEGFFKLSFFYNRAESTG